MTGLVTQERTDDMFYGTYKGHIIDIIRDEDHNGWYYIRVFNDNGSGYDGWWDNAEASMDEAIEEAIKGAML